MTRPTTGAWKQFPPARRPPERWYYAGPVARLEAHRQFLRGSTPRRGVKLPGSIAPGLELGVEWACARISGRCWGFTIGGALHQSSFKSPSTGGLDDSTRFDWRLGMSLRRAILGARFGMGAGLEAANLSAADDLGATTLKLVGVTRVGPTFAGDWKGISLGTRSHLFGLRIEGRVAYSLGPASFKSRLTTDYSVGLPSEFRLGEAWQLRVQPRFQYFDFKSDVATGSTSQVEMLFLLARRF